MNWTTVKLSDVADIERKGVDPSAIKPDTSYLGLEHIESGGQILGAQTVASGDLASTKFRFSADHILYGKLRPYLAKIALPSFDGICSTDILPVRPGPKINRQYLAHFLRQPSMVSFATSRSTGANLPRLSPKALAEFEIPLPPLDEQNRIAAILDQADALRRLRQRAIDRLNTLGQAIFYEMFGDLTANECSFDPVAVGDVIDGFETGKNLAEDPDAKRADGYRVLKISAVTSGTFKPEQSKPLPLEYEPPESHIVRDGDLLFSRANTAQLIGATAFARTDDSNLVLPDKLWRFVWKNSSLVLPKFVKELFSSPPFRYEIGKRSSGTSGSMKNIGKQKVMTIEFGLPSMDLQEEFSRKLSAANNQAEANRKLLRTSGDLFASLQNRAFRGEL